MPELLTVGGKYVVLKDDKVIEGSATVRGDNVIVRQGALDRTFTKSQVQYVAESKDEVYRRRLATVPATDTAARLKVARWCMFNGMREQALIEAHEVQKLQPSNSDAASLARSLELSLKQFPPENAPKMTAPTTPVFPTELRTVTPPLAPTPAEPEPEVAQEAANLFATRVQPFLANQCVGCHAKPDIGKFKLARVEPGDLGVQPTRTNLRAVAAQLRKDEPVSSPFLLKVLTAHGGQKLPSVGSRQTVAYQTLEAWTALAVGTPVMAAPAVPPMPNPALPGVPTAPPTQVTPVLPPPSTDPVLPLPPPVVDSLPRTTPTLPITPTPPAPPVGNPVLPPVSTPPAFPTPPALPAPQVAPAFPTIPAPSLPAPTVPAPTVPVIPAPSVSVPTMPVIPIEPVVPNVPSIPQADPFLPKAAPPVAPLPKPVVPPIPPASAGAPAPLPPLPSGPLPPVQPVSGSQFGTTLPPKPPVSGPMGGDEFDPAGFNQGPPRK